ncbi:hypothetical protein F5B19DRAFT_472208 [Rostrohypoxylon terebratum]|nr:hypothetical protein F5B19DRAFT_472208 [Rostrohypoxylon terebratum]
MSVPSRKAGVDLVPSQAVTLHENKMENYLPMPIPTSPSGPFRATTSEFPCFKQLPAEIRIMIWEMAASSGLKEILEIQPLPSGNPLSSQGELAVFKVKMDKTRMNVAQACYESWEILRGQSSVSNWPRTPMQTCMDQDLDTLMFHADISFERYWMKPKTIIGNAQHIIVQMDDDYYSDILDSILPTAFGRRIEGGKIPSIKTISCVVDTFRIPSNAKALIRKHFSAQVPFVVDLDDDEQINKMAVILDHEVGQSLELGNETLMSIALHEECLNTRLNLANFIERVKRRIRDNAVMGNFKSPELPDVKRVLLILDEFDERPDTPLLDRNWALEVLGMHPFECVTMM